MLRRIYGPIVIAFVLCFLIGIVSVHAKKEWDVRKGTNFIIYSRDVPEDFVETVMNSAEEEFQQVTQNLGITRYQNWAWDKRASIYIYRDQQDYMENGGQAGWSHGAAIVETKTIKTFPMANGFFDSILPHELGHIILHELIGQRISVPLWFDEGVAVNQEKARGLGAHKTVKQAIENGQFIPLTQLMDMRLYKNTDQQVIELFYAESTSIVYYMLTELGQQRFYRFCHELKTQPFKQALVNTYVRVKSIDDLNKMWIKYLEDQ